MPAIETSPARRQIPCAGWGRAEPAPGRRGQRRLPAHRSVQQVRVLAAGRTRSPGSACEPGRSSSCRTLPLAPWQHPGARKSKGLGSLCQRLRGPESLQISKSLQSENLYSALQSSERAFMDLTFAAGLRSSPSCLGYTHRCPG